MTTEIEKTLPLKPIFFLIIVESYISVVISVFSESFDKFL